MHGHESHAFVHPGVGTLPPAPPAPTSRHMQSPRTPQPRVRERCRPPVSSVPSPYLQGTPFLGSLLKESPRNTHFCMMLSPRISQRTRGRGGRPNSEREVLTVEPQPFVCEGHPGTRPMIPPEGPCTPASTEAVLGSRGPVFSAFLDPPAPFISI